MITAKVKYIGQLRTEATHVRSNNHIITDAPVDNNGKGEAFSPTDLVATSLASCMLTIMGIKAETNAINFNNASVDVIKQMAADPRRISAISLSFVLSKSLSEKERKLLEHAAKTCPVAHSIHPDIKTDVVFNYQ